MRSVFWRRWSALTLRQRRRPIYKQFALPSKNSVGLFLFTCITHDIARIAELKAEVLQSVFLCCPTLDKPASQLCQQHASTLRRPRRAPIKRLRSKCRRERGSPARLRSRRHCRHVRRLADSPNLSSVYTQSAIICGLNAGRISSQSSSNHSGLIFNHANFCKV